MTDNDESSTTVNLVALGLLSPFVFSTTTFAAPNRVTGFHGHEEVSHPFRFDVDIIIAESDAAALADALGDTALLEIQLPAGGTRKVAGVVASIDDGPCLDQGRQTFRVRLVPMLWLLGLRKTSRIFQEKTVVEIVTAVLDGASVPHREALVGTYAKRVYCVQHQETDLAFVTRLLAEEGIAFFFEHASSGETVVLADNVHAYSPIAGDPALVFRAVREGMIPEERHVGPFAPVRAMASGKVLHRDYDFRKPRLDLRAAADAKAARQDALQVYDHEVGDELPNVDAGTAGRRLEQERRHAEVLRGGSACRRLLPGFTFALGEHEIGAHDGAYVIERVEHRGHAPRVNAKLEQLYENTFRCVAADRVLRPARPVREIRQVTETAVVVGPDGQDIYTDEHGRVKVQFPWDLDGKNNETSSCWVRVAQAWSGTGFGFQFIPRVGMEVVVTFLGGDTDRPIITGCVPNALNVTPFKLPVNQTVSGIRTQTTPGGKGYNELSFQDKQGNEAVNLRAERDHNENVSNDQTVTVGGDQTIAVKRDRFVKVARHQDVVVTGNHREEVRGQRELTVHGSAKVTYNEHCHTSGRGSMSQSCAGRGTTAYGEHHSVTIAGDYAVVVGGGGAELGGNASLYAAKTYAIGTDGTLRFNAKTSIELRVGDSAITITPDAVKIQGKSLQILGGKAVSVVSDGPAIYLTDDAEIVAKKIRILAEKSAIELDDDAHVRGEKVLLNCDRNDPALHAGDGAKEETKPFTIKATDPDFKSYAGKHYVLTVGAKKFDGLVGGDGSVTHDVPKDATSADLMVWEKDYPTGPRRHWALALAGPLPPLATPQGIEARLGNLGYKPGKSKGDTMSDTTRAALAEFQKDHNLPADEKVTPETLAALAERHGH
jgi:type VI secretion system secreted protein VgrG